MVECPAVLPVGLAGSEACAVLVPEGGVLFVCGWCAGVIMQLDGKNVDSTNDSQSPTVDGVMWGNTRRVQNLAQPWPAEPVV